MDSSRAVTLRFEQAGQEFVLEAEPLTDGWRVRLPNGSLHDIAVRRLPQNVVQVTEQKGSEVEVFAVSSFRVPFALAEGSVLISYDGDAYRFKAVIGRRAGGTASAGSGLLTAPMGGVLVDILVTEGQAVRAGQPLAVMEAMKVMTTLEAPFPGKVHKIYAEKAQRIEPGAPVVEIIPTDGAAAEADNA